MMKRFMPAVAFALFASAVLAASPPAMTCKRYHFPQVICEISGIVPLDAEDPIVSVWSEGEVVDLEHGFTVWLTITRRLEQIEMTYKGDIRIDLWAQWHDREIYFFRTDPGSGGKSE